MNNPATECQATEFAASADAQFLAALEATTLPAAEFTHRNHLRAAWLYLAKHPLPEAAMCCALSIQKYATALGVPGKFHLTLTLAFMHIVAELRGQHSVDDWEAFLAVCPQLERDAQQLIGRHYSEALLQSERARKTFVPPDRAPLPLPQA